MTNETPLTRKEALATKTPNVGPVKDPARRELLNNILAGAGLVLGTAMVVDLATPSFDIEHITEPIFVGYAYVAAYFGFAVTRPNYPKF